jgi:hypothetical protein
VFSSSANYFIEVITEVITFSVTVHLIGRSRTRR